MIGQRRTHHNVSRWKILSLHVNQIFQDCQRYAFRHVDNRTSWRIPSRPDSACPFPIQTRMNRPADSKHAAHYDGKLCSMRVSVCSTNASPSSVSSNS